MLFEYDLRLLRKSLANSIVLKSIGTLSHVLLLDNWLLRLIYYWRRIIVICGDLHSELEILELLSLIDFTFIK